MSIKHSISGFNFFLVLVLFFIFSCSPTKNLSEGENLYNKVKLKVDDKRFDKEELTRYERISPNKRVLGIRFHLGIYNFSNPSKKGFPHDWFRRIGEEPVVYDSIKVQQNLTNYKKHLSDIGYNKVKVDAEITRSKEKRVDVNYYVELGTPTIINLVNYQFEDTTLQKYVFADTASSLVKANMIFDKTQLQAERLRLEVLLKNKGFYNFSKEYVYYEIENSNKPDSVNVTLKIKQSLSGYVDPVTKIRPHKQYMVNNVLIYPDIQKTMELKVYDTIQKSNFTFSYPGNIMLKPGTIVAASRIIPQSLYSLEDVNRTYTNLSALGLFRFINISFNEKEADEDYGNLDCKVELAMRKRQSYDVEIVGTNSGSDLGIRSNITYNNYNIFKGGEHLQVGVSGAIESLKNRLQSDDPMRELGVNSKFETPKFLIPFSPEEFQRKYSPRTVIQMSYSHQSQPDYIRTIANASFGYSWRGNSYNKHSIFPIDFYLVKLPWRDSAYFVDNIEGTRWEYSYINHTILGIRYSFEYSNQSQTQTNSFIYIKYSLEQAGLFLNIANKLSNWGEDSLLFGVEYSQYIRTELDFRHYTIINPRNKLVYRFLGGIAIPYGNSEAMPFEKMFWAGGPYDIRAWSERSLGPGTYQNTSSSYNNQTGDIKLEGNLEYRFKLFWDIEGALFVDAGNIWSLKEDESISETEDSDEEQPRANFTSNFYEDIAIGTGFGTRFDFSFVLIRLDFGFKLRDPALQGGSKWTIDNSSARFWDMTFQWGIGYPF